MPFPEQRPRRMRYSDGLRRLIRETHLHRDNLIMPLFVRPGTNIRKEISGMPGNFQWSVDLLAQEVLSLERAGVHAVLLFGIPERKDDLGTEAYSDDGIVQRALRAIKTQTRKTVLITDICLCEYTSHGHCGVVQGDRVENDKTLELLAKVAVSHARAGADMVAPSDMMDGRVAAIRRALDAAGFPELPIMSYAAKYASAFYDPFREAAESAPKFGDRRSYQMDPPNAEEALREVALDLEEGADVIMVKPALAYLDLVYRVKDRFGCPVAAYNVSGEFAMVKAAAQKGWIDERPAVWEMLTSIKRAGADIIVTYWAKEVAGWVASEM